MIVRLLLCFVFSVTLLSVKAQSNEQNLAPIWLYVDGDPIKKLEALNAEMDTTQESAVQHIARGYYYYQLHKYTEAASDYEAAVRLEPNEPYPYLSRGTFYVNIEKAEQGISDLDICIAMYNAMRGSIDTSNYALAHYQKANALSKLGKNEEALAYYNQAIALHYLKHDIYYNRAVVLSKLGRKHDAITDYDICISKDSLNRAQYYTNRGVAKLELQQTDSAIADFNQAIVYDSASYQAYFNKANALSGKGKQAEAILAFGMTIKYNPNMGEAYYNRAVLNIAIKQNKGVCVDLKKAQSLGIKVRQDLIGFYCR